MREFKVPTTCKFWEGGWRYGVLIKVGKKYCYILAPSREASNIRTKRISNTFFGTNVIPTNEDVENVLKVYRKIENENSSL